MISLWLLKIFLAEYIIIGLVALLKKEFPLAVYMAGSAILTIGVIWFVIKTATIP